MIIQEDGRKIKLLLDLTEEMLHTMKTQFPERVYFAKYAEMFVKYV